MNWKRLLLIALVAGGIAFVPAPRSEAQVVSVRNRVRRFRLAIMAMGIPVTGTYRPLFATTGPIGLIATTGLIGMDGRRIAITATTVMGLAITVVGNEVT